MYQKIMIAIDLSDSSAQVLAKASQFLSEQPANYQVVCCYEPMITTMTDMSLSFSGFDDANVLNAMRSRLQALVTDAGLDAEKTQVIENMVGPGLCQHAESLKADVIIVGRHGRSGLRLLLGSTANYVLHHAHCDVLAVKIDE